MTEDRCRECAEEGCSSDCNCWCHGVPQGDDDPSGTNITADCDHVTSEPARCPECQELLCPPCLADHDC